MLFLTVLFLSYRILQAAGPDGINKVVATFLGIHGHTMSKRQVEIRINEMAVKEKHPGDKYIVWHIKPEYQRYLHMSTTDFGGADAAATSTGSATKKRKHTASGAEDSGLDDINSPATAAATSAKDLPKRFKRAFGFFVKAKRSAAEAQLGGSTAAVR